MKIIERKSTFDLTQITVKEKEELLELFSKRCNGRSFYDEENMINYYNYLYYLIGKIDYGIAYNFPAKRRTIEQLRERTKYSVLIQMLEKEMKDGNINIPSDKEISVEEFLESTENLNKNAIVSLRSFIKGKEKVLYHGTPMASFINEQDLGKPHDGKFDITDGVIYFSIDREESEQYVEGTDTRTGEKRVGGILERKVSSEDKMIILEETSGGTAFHSQAKLLELAQSGIRYVLNGRGNNTHVMDISMYLQFVKDRDSRMNNLLEKHDLELPKDNATYADYMKYLDIKDVEVKKEKR